MSLIQDDYKIFVDTLISIVPMQLFNNVSGGFEGHFCQHTYHAINVFQKLYIAKCMAICI